MPTRVTGGLGLVWSNTEGDHVNSVSRSHGRGEIGFSYGLDDNVQIDLESFYDGIGTFGYEGYRLSLSAERNSEKATPAHIPAQSREHAG